MHDEIDAIEEKSERTLEGGGPKSTNCDAFDEIEEFFKSGSLLGAAARA